MDLRQNNLDQTWVYLRMSTEDQEDSPLTQSQHTGEFIHKSSLAPWTRTYFDLGRSGSSIDRRPGMLSMLTEAERLRPSAIVFYRLDRAFRNAEEQAVALNRLKRWGVKIFKVRDPNLQGPMGELIDGILGNINQFERQLTGMRIRDHNLAMAQRGEWPGGKPPFGYRYRKPVRESRGRKRVTLEPGRLEPDEKEWPVARRLWDWALAGYRKIEIVDMANGAGLRRRNGGRWNSEALTLLLVSRTYAGDVPYSRHVRVQSRCRRQWDQAEWYPGNHPPLVTLDEWLRVQSTTNRQMGQRHAHRRPRCELAGLVRCRLCGGRVVGNSFTKDGGYHYCCASALQHEAEHPVWSRRDWVIHMALLRILDEVVPALPPEPPATLVSGNRESIQEEIQQLRNQIRRQRVLFEMGEYGDEVDAYIRRRQELEAQIAAREAERATSGPARDEMAKRWATLRAWDAVYHSTPSIREKQRVWASLVEEVRIDARTLWVRLRDFGPSVGREWAIDLPPRRARRPTSGVNNGSCATVRY